MRAWNSRSLVVFLSAVALAKLALLVLHGPFTESDAEGYSSYADLILSGGGWLDSIVFDQGATPITALRPIGFPALWALMRLIFGHQGGDYGVIVVQIALSLFATALVYRVAFRLLGVTWMALLVTAGYGLSIQFLYDLMLLTDSVFNSTLVIIFALPALAVLEAKPVRLRTLAVVSACILLAQSWRAVLMYLGYSFAPILIWWLGRDLRARWPKMIGRLCAMVLPIVIFLGATVAWNEMRSGYPFVVIGTTVPIQGMVKAAGRGRAVFDGDTPIDHAAHAILRQYSYPEVLEIEDAVRRDTGFNAVEMARLESALYFRSWAHHPLAMLEVGLNNFSPHIVGQFFDFEDGLDTSVSIVTTQHILPPFRALKAGMLKGDAVAIVTLAATGILRVVSWLLFTLFALGVPILWLRDAIKKKERTIEISVLAAGWFAFMAYLAPLLLLHFAIRFLPAVLPWGLIGAVFVARDLWLRMHKRTNPTRMAT
ncbi:MAG TPA: hypothetical protein VGG27_07075 [Magnetospirillaceae bacterium]|jgi:hypothetical protein